MQTYILRDAVADDLELTFGWANDAEVRMQSFHSERITLQEHTGWFHKMLLAEDVDYFIYGTEEVPIGQVRLQYQNGTATVSYSIAKEYRRQGHGERMLLLAEEEVRRRRKDVVYLLAEVKPENQSSRHRFQNLGYEEEEIVRYKKLL